MTLTSGTLLPHSHDPWLVALSVLIAVGAAYTALEQRLGAYAWWTGERVHRQLTAELCEAAA